MDAQRYLNTIEQGAFIDTHDTVIRAHSNLPYPSPKFKLEIDNDESFVPKAFHERLGTKTTVFAPANLSTWLPDYADKIVTQLMRRGCAAIIQHKSYSVDGSKAVAINDYISDRYVTVYVASPVLLPGTHTRDGLLIPDARYDSDKRDCEDVAAPVVYHGFLMLSGQQRKVAERRGRFVSGSQAVIRFAGTYAI